MTAHPFQYAVLRYIHDPITEEFLNIGVVVYSRESRYLQTKISKRYGRVSQTFGGIHRTNYNRTHHECHYASYCAATLKPVKAGSL